MYFFIVEWVITLCYIFLENLLGISHLLQNIEVR